MLTLHTWAVLLLRFIEFGEHSLVGAHLAQRRLDLTGRASPFRGHDSDEKLCLSFGPEAQIHRILRIRVPRP